MAAVVITFGCSVLAMEQPVPLKPVIKPVLWTAFKAVIPHEEARERTASAQEILDRPVSLTPRPVSKVKPDGKIEKYFRTITPAQPESAAQPVAQSVTPI